jgi:molecular chaperone DnaJ
MNTQEACAILGVSLGADDEEINKKFRQKAAELHPDKNPNGEDAFKKANEAYQFLKKHGSNAPQFDLPSDFGFGNSWAQTFNLDDLFSGSFRRVRTYGPQNPKANVSLSFEESILGCDKDVLIARRTRCSACSGAGVIASDKEVQCHGCRGSGTKNVFGNIRQCNNCAGKGKAHTKITCSVCSGIGGIVNEQTIKVAIPPGAEDNGMVRLTGLGDYVPNLGGYTDCFIRISVGNSQEFIRDGGDVISTLEVSLLDALKGTTKKVRTVKGEKTLKLKPGVKNKDPVRVPGFGVPPDGAHVFILDVQYPENTDAIIKALENETTETIEE